MNRNTDHEVKAFPFAAEYGHPAGCGGMTLRDYFAGLAMQSLVSHVYSDGVPCSTKSTAQDAYAIAEAMMTHREILPDDTQPPTSEGGL